MSARIEREKTAALMGGAERTAGSREWVSHLEKVVTLEIALYIGALLLGATLRLFLLDIRPLSIEEGTLATESFRLALAQPPETLQQGPLLAYGTALSLFLFGGSDFAARLLPAIFGSAIIAVPYMLRWSLGRPTALVAAYGIALSPILLFASRDLGGGMVALSLGAFLFAALDRGFKYSSKIHSHGVAILLAGLVASGVEGVSVLLTLGVAALLAHPHPARLLANIRSVIASPLWRQAALVFAATVFALCTGLGTRFEGAQWALTDVWTNWIGSFTLSTPRGGLVALLALYEMPVLFLGLIQLFRAMFQRQHIDMFLSLWLMLLLLLGMVQQADSVSRLVLPALPLYLLAARLVSDSYALFRYANQGWRWAVTSVAVTVPAGVAIVLLNRASSSRTEIPSPFLYGEAALVIVAVLAVVFILQGKERLALGWYAFAIIATGFLLHSTVFLNFRIESIGQELVVGSQTTTYLRDAAKEAAYFSRYYFQTVTVDPDLNEATQWYLREAPNVRYSADVSEGISLGLVRTGQIESEPSAERRPGVLVPVTDARDLSWRGLWAWLVKRDSLVRANQRDIIIRSPAGNW